LKVFFLFFLFLGIGLRMRKNHFDLKSRFREVIRRSEELSAISLKLTNMALQLDGLRKLNGETELLGAARPEDTLAIPFVSSLETPGTPPRTQKQAYPRN
jgi:hypothetical protein